jgi:hypothetical protein
MAQLQPFTKNQILLEANFMLKPFRKTLTAFIMFTLGACQILPPGTENHPETGFRIQSHSKPELRPFVECVAPNRDGSFTAFFGYENSLGKTINLPVGDHNKILENPGTEQDEEHGDFSVKAQTEKDKSPSKSEGKEKSAEEKQSSKNKEHKSEQEKEKHSDNRHSNQDRGQPTVFPVGKSQAWPNSPLAVVFNQERLTWQLGENQATASIRDKNQYCSTSTTPTQIAYPGSSRKVFLAPQVISFSPQARTKTLNFNLNASDNTFCFKRKPLFSGVHFFR